MVVDIQMNLNIYNFLFFFFLKKIKLIEDQSHKFLKDLYTIFIYKNLERLTKTSETLNKT